MLLARLFALPANVLVLDEPTNDLDIDTLELLEELLQGYAGTVFLVSHDRRFLDNVVTSTIAWEGDEGAGAVARVRGRLRGLEDAARARARACASRRRRSASPERPRRARALRPAPPAPRRKAPAKPRKLSYKEQRELDALPDRSRRWRPSRRRSARLLSDATVYAKEPDRAAAAQARHAQIDAELTRALERWEALGSR